ncbi:DUF3742 family protein [Pseudomonas syringae]|uniref:DUF3742 family protein n=2 Tax=Pseudomonas syringae TaxID=317 RepID=A0A6B2AW45_PSESX|nr:DUF3742 family protein [Pseudomonas syringae]PYD17805.1 DUF3742 domain-containing protein [Pseudomonas syringae pv. syringae]PYD23986.1 DUF3742 domain-containing protein [Pseudomonas syringae pv. pisi]MDC6489725.1 DUF3742 family protein [Pseudomonas syringae]MDC6493665.1 DUF3742 family protein [Pseudomonas syringae]MDC6499463.1 DUF3742 family protein [Pseudomonas syringae]
MTTNAGKNGSAATRVGHALGRGVGGILHTERAIWTTLVRAGVPNAILSPVKWAARVSAMVLTLGFAAWGLLYAAGLLAMVSVAFALLSGTRGSITGSGSLQTKSSNPELQDGYEGCGLYVDDVRVD